MKAVSRRKVLRGWAGATLALPALDIFEGKAKAATKPTYAVFVVGCNGVVQNLGEEPEMFWPSTTGALTTAKLEADAKSRATGRLSRFASKLLLVRGVNQSFLSPRACSHTWGDNQCLTATPGSEDKDGPASSLAQGESIDHRIAREKNANGRGPLVLHAGRNSTGGKGYGNPGYVSYKGPMQPHSPDSSPWAAYTRIVGLAGGNADALKLVATRRKSVNDFVRSQIKRLQSRADLSAEDKRRLDAHFTAIRDIELGMTAGLPSTTLKEMEAMDGKDANMRLKVHVDAHRDALVRLHMDLIAFAFAGDITRSASLKVGDNNDGISFVLDGVTLPSFHMISHRVMSDGSDGDPIPNAVETHARIDRLLMDQFGYLGDKLAASTSPDGSLLDRGFAVWTNQIANGAHDGRSLPYVILGAANGRLKTGRFMDAGGVSHNQLMNALLAAADVTKPGGAPVDDFGDAGLPKRVLPDIVV
ncbi:MAG: DUF1552 domain-containing protein [Deltaproteobacteria bacterium]|nr:DUF1552 domain-containing protein [Deltaproteobacteria bacterium]